MEISSNLPEHEDIIVVENNVHLEKEIKLNIK